MAELLFVFYGRRVWYWFRTGCYTRHANENGVKYGTGHMIASVS